MKGKIVVITGASGGIGAAAAAEISKRGASLVLVARRAGALQSVAARCGDRALALTANFRAEVQTTHPGIQFSLVSPGVVRTDFGVNALHGGPDSRVLPDSQSAEEVATVIADVIESRVPDAYTRKRAHDRRAAR